MYSLLKSISSKKINFKSIPDLFFTTKFKILVILLSIFIGALNSDLTAQENKPSVKENSGTLIHCKPDIAKCIENLENLKRWLWDDYQNKMINNKTHDEYHLVVTHTISSLEMILEDKGQCDTSNDKVDLKYWTTDNSDKVSNQQSVKHLK